MLTLKELKTFLSDNDPGHLEQLARRANALTRQYFGRTISLYAPLYISNFCSSHCTYCGFSVHHKIKRIKLSGEEMEQEMKHIATTGIQNILILTGESYQATPLDYLKKSVIRAKKYFPSISLEVHPMAKDEYSELFHCGVDGITVYQETYNPLRYQEVHLLGKKKDYEFRRSTPQRAAEAGIRSISMGVLLGLSDIAEDILSLFEHLQFMERNYPGVEYNLSFPRLQPIKGMGFVPSQVDDRTLVKLICLSRILFPRVGINLSTRETSQLRDAALELGVTRFSAASKTAVGGYTVFGSKDQDPQFDIQDERSLNEIIVLLKKRNFDPVFTDWRRIENITA